MSDTPRTDSQLLTVKDCSYVAPHPTGEYVHAEFARELERENSALRQDKEILDWMNNNIEAIMFKYKPDGFTWDFRKIIGDAMSKEDKPNA